MPAGVKVFFDGGCRGRSTTTEIAVVAAGHTTVVRGLGPGTSSDTEWLALIHALTIAQSLDLYVSTLIGDAADVIAKANSELRRRGDAARIRERFRALLPSGRHPLVRYVKWSQNLAGIALARLHPR